MDNETEKRLLSTLYDRIFEMVTYSPGGQDTGNDPKSRVLMGKNIVLSPTDFQNALSPLNPQKGDAKAGYAFSAIADAIPVDSPKAEYIDSTRKVSEQYRNLVNGANAINADVDPKQLAIYNKAYDYLVRKTSITGFDGTVTETVGPTPIAQTYNNNQQAYIAAVSGYRTAMLNYNLDNVDDQRKWQAQEPMLNNLVMQTWNAWVQQGKQQVEQAQAALQATINNAVTSAIGQAQGLVAPGAWMASTGFGPWLLSFAMPTDWMLPSSKASQMSITNDNLTTNASASATSYSAGGSGSWGLWSAGGSYSSDHKEAHESMKADRFELSAEFIQVRINRPWYNPLLLSMNGWYMRDQRAGYINGSDVMPLVPSSFVIARNVTIKADFKDSDHTHIENSVKATASVGWGPFTASSSYSHSDMTDMARSSFTNGTLKLPGLQLIAVVCARTPSSPPEADPNMK